MNRYLITTADERSWKWDQPVLFLGEWCRLYDRKSRWEGMDSIVMDPFGVEPGQKERNLYYTLDLSMRLLPEIARVLNALHGETHGLRYWNILLGHWTQRFVAAAFNRFFTLKQAVERHGPLRTIIFDSSNYSLAARDTLSAIWSFDNDVWNHVLYANALRRIDGVSFEVDRDALAGVRMFSVPANGARRRGIKSRMLSAAGSLLRQFSRPNDAFLMSTYLPLEKEFALQIALGQIPQFWESIPVPDHAPDPGFRQRLRNEAGACRENGEFEQFVSEMLWEALPTCYVEGYRELVTRALTTSWPREPRFIFTANNYDTDEVFKVWTADKVEKGVPYFVGQHGNNYGTLVGSEFRPEVLTADRFISWGWTDGTPKVAPAFILKLARKSRIDRNRKGDLLLIGLHAPHRMEPEDSIHEHGLYQQEQFEFLAALPDSIRRQVRVRLHGSFREFRWADQARWADRYPETVIEAGEVRFSESLSRSRLVVYSYDSTGIMENMALNSPMIAFWRGGTGHVLPAARNCYEALFACGVFSDSPARAAQVIAAHWDELDSWWAGKAIQEARRHFCEAFARLDPDPLGTLSRLLTTDIPKGAKNG